MTQRADDINRQPSNYFTDEIRLQYITTALQSPRKRRKIVIGDNALTVVPESAGGSKEGFAIICCAFEILSAIIRRAYVPEALCQCSFTVYSGVIVLITFD